MAIEYSDEVLEETPTRVTKFICGIGAEATIRTLLEEGGMSEDELVEGKNLLMECLAAPRGKVEAADTEAARQQRAATAELDEWDEPNFARYQAALVRHAPEVAEYVFAKLSASTGPKATEGVATFLARVDALENGSDPARASTKKSDKKAVELLAKRGLDRKERERLKARVKVALGPTTVLSEKPVATEVARAARREKLVALKQWFDEWSTAARAVVKKRSHLLRLGLAQRKVKAKAAPEPEPTPPAPVASAPNPAPLAPATGSTA